MVLKVLARDAEHIEVLDRGRGIADRDVQRLCSWVASHLRTAEARDRIGEFVLARRSPGSHGASCFTFVAHEEA
jgi:hypothetical protein